jgi:hypothetical protein
VDRISENPKFFETPGAVDQISGNPKFWEKNFFKKILKNA